LKCLRKEPARRYGSAQALADDLQRFRNGRSIQARRATGIERMWRWCRRNPIVAASLMGVVVTFMVAFLLVSRSYWRAEAARAEEARQRQESERREMAERRERYRANLIAVASALQDHDAVTAGRLLDGMPEEYRNWEGRHFYSRLDAAKEVVARSDMPISSVLVIANGRRAVMYGPEHDVDVWDTVAGKRVGHFSSVSELDSARISPDGQMLAYVPNQTEAFVIDVASGQVNTRVGGRGRAISYFRFSADSTRLTTISVDQTVSIWNPMTGELLKSQRPKHSRAIAIELSPCFQRALYKTTEGKLYCWDLETENEVELPHAYPRGWHSFWFSPKGDRVLAVEDYRSNTIHLWDAATGRLIRTMSGHDNELTTHAFSPDGTRLATGSRDKTVQLWDVRSGERLAVLRGHRGWVSDVKFSPDGSRLVSGALDHNIHIWDAISGTQLAVLHGHTADVASVMYSADGTEIVSAARDGTVRRWDAHTVESGGVLRGHASYVYRVAFHPDGELVASASWDGTARLWNATTGRQTASLPHGDEKVVTSVDFHPGGRLLATRARDAVRLWDVVTGAEVQCWRSPISSWRDTRAMFSPDGALIAAGCEKGVIRIWNVSNRSEVAALRGHRDDVRDLAFSPDGRWLASAGEIADKTVRIWDLATMKSMQVLDGHTNTVYTVAFSSDGKWLASGSTDGTVRLYDTATWRLISVLTHGPNVYGVAFTKDNTRLACACADNSIRFWDTETLQEVAVLRGHSDYVHAIAFSPDGSRLASASGDFTVRIWDTLRSAQRVRSGR
jgi:WD40 repeat protein